MVEVGVVEEFYINGFGRGRFFVEDDFGDMVIEVNIERVFFVVVRVFGVLDGDDKFVGFEMGFFVGVDGDLVVGRLFIMEIVVCIEVVCEKSVDV